LHQLKWEGIHLGARVVIPLKRYTPEQIVTLLRHIEVELVNGKTTPRAGREAEIPVQSYSAGGRSTVA
jgi:hypothetical protein